MSDEKSAYEHLSLLGHVETLVDKRILDAIEKHEMDNSHTITEIHHFLTSISKQISALESQIKSGFPMGDPVTHRLVHENYIKEANAKAKIWEDVQSKVVTGAIWAALLAIAAASWSDIKNHLK